MSWFLLFGVVAIVAGLTLAAVFDVRGEGFVIFVSGILAVAAWIVGRQFEASRSGSGLRVSGSGFLLLVGAQIAHALLGPGGGSLVWAASVVGITLMIFGIGRQIAQVLQNRNA